MTQKNKKLRSSIKLEIIHRIIDGIPISPLIDDLKPDEILGVYRFVLETTVDFGRALHGPGFSKKDISHHLLSLNLDKIETPDTISSQNLISALHQTKKQIDGLAEAARQFALSK